MHDQPEESGMKKSGIFGRKAALAGAFFVIFSAVAAFVLFSQPTVQRLRSGGAVAVRSFEDMLTPPAAIPVVSDVDVAPIEIREASGTAEAGTSSVAVRPTEQNSPRTAPDRGLEDNTVIVPIASAKVSVGAVIDATSSPVLLPLPDVEVSSSLISVSSSTPTVTDAAICPFPRRAPTAISRRIILNEIAWMGLVPMVGETAAYAADREWIELKNISGEELSLSGWRIVDAAGKIDILFGSGDTIPASGFYLLSRGGGAVRGISADKAYTGILSNLGDALAVFDASCDVSDITDVSEKWSAGSNATKQTMERTVDLGWQTSTSPGGTPRAENSPGVPVKALITSSTPKFNVNVMVGKDGPGEVAVKPGGSSCETNCVYSYSAGEVISLEALPGKGVDFIGWSGACSGDSSCSLVVNGAMSVTAEFHLHSDKAVVLPVATLSPAFNEMSVFPATDTLEDASATSSQGTAVVHPLIVAVQIVGASASHDFVKIYNPAAGAVDVGGWKLRKKTSTGNDASLREFPKGSTIAAKAYFIWASSADDFAGSIGADASSTGTLSANNSVALFDATGAQIDAVAWGTGVSQYAYGAPYPNNPAAGQILERKIADGMEVDTGNNADDFTVQASL